MGEHFMMKSLKYLVLLVVLFSSYLARAALIPDSPFNAYLDQSHLYLETGSQFEANLVIDMPEDHYVYADKTEVFFETLEGVQIDDIAYPTATSHEDPFLGKQSLVYTGRAVIRITGHIPEDLEVGKRELVMGLELQGCTPQLCLRPESRSLSLFITVLNAQTRDSSQSQNEIKRSDEAPSFWNLLDAERFSTLTQHGMGLTLLVVFLAGLLTSLTPCVWPLIPVTLLVVGIHPESSLKRNALLSFSLVCGMVLVYAVLGMMAALLGKNLGFLFQSRFFLALIVIVFLTMSLSMLGLFHLRLPQKLHHFLHQLGGSGICGAFLAGLGTGIIATPCVGPVIAAILTYVLLQKSYLLGFVMLVVYGFGMGLLFLLLGIFSASVSNALKNGPWMVWVKRLLGLILLLPALYYFGVLVGYTPNRFFGQTQVQMVHWISSEQEGLQLARDLQKPIVIDFYADWCPPCLALEKKFFSRSDIASLSEKFVMIRVDATTETEEVKRVIDKYKVVGWPTVLLLSPDGTVYEDLVVTAYEPDRLERNMYEALKLLPKLNEENENVLP